MRQISVPIDKASILFSGLSPVSTYGTNLGLRIKEDWDFVVMTKECR